MAFFIGNSDNSPKVTFIKFQDPSKNKKRDRIFFSSMAALGLLTIFFATWPLIVWQLFTVPSLTNPIDKIPIPKGQVLAQKTSLFSDVQIIQDPDGFSYFTTSKLGTYGPRPQKFTLTVPKLHINSADVKVDEISPDSHLALFPGSAIPGEVGNAFVTGHSALPQFFDPYNYSTIFSNLEDLEVGDDIYAQVDGKNFQYVVQYKKIVDPQDTRVLAPISAQGKNLTLMTCVPPGSSIKRLIVVTSLI